jgi:hypothetical protein
VWRGVCVVYCIDHDTPAMYDKCTYRTCRTERLPRCGVTGAPVAGGAVLFAGWAGHFIVLQIRRLRAQAAKALHGFGRAEARARRHSALISGFSRVVFGMDFL